MPNVTLKLVIGSFSVEVTGPQQYADRKLEELIGRYVSSSVRSATQDPSSSRALKQSAGKKLSPPEFLKKLKSANQTDRAVALGYFLERLESQTNFTTSELRDLGRKAKNPFTNVSDSVARLVARGLMMSAGEKDGQRAYALTASGEEYVESMLAGS
jgi:hypothetical protein